MCFSGPLLIYPEDSSFLSPVFKAQGASNSLSSSLLSPSFGMSQNQIFRPFCIFVSCALARFSSFSRLFLSTFGLFVVCAFSSPLNLHGEFAARRAVCYSEPQEFGGKQHEMKKPQPIVGARKCALFGNGEKS